ncbi:hypothetical protein [Lentimicrobium sp. S6]|uniref:hypothetical protein n=1 Tax=Lentimicrobium sp. S6 TaxID=2735872 RepID=UPI001553AE41|nr:hypothetical protein [Lentimicrobium sp. S6]NPD45383.1 hypothetical protein [Lentimicrobium sp. S6]
MQIKKAISRISKILLLGILTLFLMSFTPIKYDKIFKKDKQKVDTLIMIMPYVQVFAHDNEEVFMDIELSILNENLIDSVSKDILDRKYVFKNITLKPDALGLSDLFEKLEASPKYLNNISAQNIFMKQEIIWESKYAIMIFLEGYHLAAYPPHYFRNAQLKSNTIMIPINNSTESEIDLRLIMINTESNEIVYYDKVNSSQYDPRLPNEIENMVRQILKKIYYK